MSPAIWLKWVMTSTDKAELSIVWDYAVENGLVCLHTNSVIVPFDWLSHDFCLIDLRTRTELWDYNSIRRNRGTCELCRQ